MMGFRLVCRCDASPEEQKRFWALADDEETEFYDAMCDAMNEVFESRGWTIAAHYAEPMEGT